jgi:hypothetical protein
MKKKIISTVALCLAFAMIMPMSAMAFGAFEEETAPNNDNYYNETPALDEAEGDGLLIFPERTPTPRPEPLHRVGEDGQFYVRLRHFAYTFGAEVQWDGARGAVRLTASSGIVHVIVLEEVGGFVENGVSWVPIELVPTISRLLEWRGVSTMVDAIPVFEEWELPIDEEVQRIDLTLWDAERFTDVREASFSTELPHGDIAVNYIRHMNDYLPARSAFTYRELETATWLVEELLSMGHEWGNISVQEFTYWDSRRMELDLWGGLSWWLVTSPMILGVDRDYQLREDRVSQNVILTIPGQSERKIIVGAHYDSPPYPSASDNASGSALLLESAQRMLELDNYYTIVYVWFGAEEVGLIGAQYYYERLTQAQRDNIVMMVNADVIIEGPYIIYGTGSLPVIGDETGAFRAEMIERMLEGLYDITEQGLEEFIEMGWLAPNTTLESFIMSNLIGSIGWIAAMDDDDLIRMAVLAGVFETEIDSAARSVSEFAAMLGELHDIDFLSIPDAIFGPSDHLVFLFAGHTVVNFFGAERLENLENFEHLIHRFEILFGEFVFTVLHGPHDCYHVLESYWPGMIRNNLRAYSLLLEEILTARFG